MKKLLMGLYHISNTSIGDFDEDLREAILSFEKNGFDVEVQYSFSSGFYTALVLAWKAA